EVEEVAKELPERIDIDVALEMFGPEAGAYDQLIGDVASEQRPALVLITRLRQFTSHPHLVGALTEFQASDCSAKLTRFLEIAQEIALAGHKMIVFSSFVAASDLLARHVSNRFDMPVWVLDGRTHPGERQSVVDAFSRRPGAATLVMNPTV